MVSFITGDQLVVFDPHATHLPGCRLGLRCNFLERKLADMLPGQIAPFTGWASDVAHSPPPFSGFSGRDALPGTLFRLPLRSAVQAERSAIASNHFDVTETMAMLREFSEVAGEMLLFLKHVEEIEVFVRTPVPPSQQSAQQPPCPIMKRTLIHHYAFLTRACPCKSARFFVVYVCVCVCVYVSIYIHMLLDV